MDVLEQGDGGCSKVPGHSWICRRQCPHRVPAAVSASALCVALSFRDDHAYSVSGVMRTCDHGRQCSQRKQGCSDLVIPLEMEEWWPSENLTYPPGAVLRMQREGFLLIYVRRG